MNQLANSTTTKKVLADSLRSVMTEKAFEKISVSDICDRCNMNRKSFYYHFKDKYDLVNWIFDTEFIAVAKKKTYLDIWELLTELCDYFYENREFYHKALQIDGQNSFSDYFRKLILYIIAECLPDIIGVQEIPEFQMNFFADAYSMSFQRWLSEYPAMLPEEFIEQLKSCIKYMAVGYEKME